MKRCFALVIMMIISLVYVFSDTHLGRTEDNVSDSSFVVQAYYKGKEITNYTIALSFKDIGGQQIIHDAQDPTGTKVEVASNHLGDNTGTIFTWLLKGNYGRKNTIRLKFTFSTLQANVNDHYYRPTYTIKMSQNPTRKGSENGTDISSYDTFYSSTTQVVGGGTTTAVKSDSETEFPAIAEPIVYSGYINTTSNNTYRNSDYWYRSGTCTLNIADYEQKIPGSYHYVCWVVTEFSIQ